MKANVNERFFQKHSIQDLLKRSDYWLNRQGRLAHPMIKRPQQRITNPFRGKMHSI